MARNLANMPPAEKYPSRLAEQVQVAATDAGIAVQVWMRPESARNDSEGFSLSRRGRKTRRRLSFSNIAAAENCPRWPSWARV